MNANKETHAKVPVLPYVSLVVGVAVLAFLSGAAAIKWKLFPYDYLSAARLAAESLWADFSDRTYEPARSNKYGVTVRAPGRFEPGYTFMTGCRKEICEPWMVDDKGRIVREWRSLYSTIWPRAPHLDRQSLDKKISIHGAHLFANGDVILNFHAGVPYGGGTVLLDKDSRVKWKLERNTHHDLDVLPNGEVLVLGHTMHKQADARFPTLRPPFYEDVIYRVSSTGQVVKTVSILGAIARSPFSGLLSLNYREEHEREIEWNDPLHPNNIEMLRGELAASFPLFEPGDLLVSLRNINTVGVIDGESGIFKWAVTGLFVRQHDPDFTPSGTILVFDNRGGDAKKGAARVIEIDPASQRVVWEYEGSSEQPFDSRTQCVQQRLPGGNTLIVETLGGRAFEVDRQGNIVWEYVNAVPDADGVVRTVGLLTQADRIPKDFVQFLN